MKTGIGQFVLLPLTAAVALGVLGLRIDDAWSDLLSGHAFDLVAPSMAEGTQDPGSVAMGPSAGAANPAAPNPAMGKDASSAPAAPTTSAVSSPAQNNAPAASAIDAGQKSDSAIPEDLSASEIEILQKLSQRRQEIEARAHDLDQKAALLDATEQRINSKIAEMQKLRGQLEDISKSIKQGEDARVQSLVKIYENMKPADAAKIFETLDIQVLKGLFHEMKETKSAPILAAMDPAKARAITDALIDHKDIPDIGTPSP